MPREHQVGTLLYQVFPEEFENHLNYKTENYKNCSSTHIVCFPDTDTYT